MLEVGVGEGTNFEIYPSNCRLAVLDYNKCFEQALKKNVKKFSKIEFVKFYTGFVEDMHQFTDNYFDVVLVTHVLCSVNDVPKALQEIKRV